MRHGTTHIITSLTLTLLMFLKTQQLYHKADNPPTYNEQPIGYCNWFVLVSVYLVPINIPMGHTFP